MKKIKVAILCSYTINNLVPPLKDVLLEKGFDPEIRFGGYNQFIQELMDKSSWLADFKPEIIVVALSARTYLQDLEYYLLDLSETEINGLIDEKSSFLLSAIQAYREPAKIILTTLDYPNYSPLGIMDLISDVGMKHGIDRFNYALVSFARKNRQVILIDFDKVLSGMGKVEATDEKMYYLGKLLLRNNAAAAFAWEIAGCIAATFGQRKKCIVVDLDNTLWGGVIGEDGANGIVIGDDGVGSVYRDIQRILLNWKKSGVLLAIASKNNPDDAISAFRENGAMVLKEEDFVATRICWESKSKGIASISEELNIGLESFVFLDDNPAERLEVRTHLPMVEVIDVPQDIALLPEMLKGLRLFWALALTEEDKQRHGLYMQEKSRAVLKEKVSVDDYLRELGTSIVVKKNDLSSLERITQLINKTNQFNLRTQRYSQEQVKALMESKNSMVLSLHAADKFGDLGLTGIIIINRQKENEYFLEGLLMSCRILGRNIERQFFIEAIKVLKGVDPLAILHAEYVPTQKNGMIKDFCAQMGFKMMGEGDGKLSYSLSLGQYQIHDVQSIEVKHYG